MKIKINYDRIFFSCYVGGWKKSITRVGVWGIIVMFEDCQFMMFRMYNLLLYEFNENT